MSVQKRSQAALGILNIGLTRTYFPFLSLDGILEQHQARDRSRWLR